MDMTYSRHERAAEVQAVSSELGTDDTSVFA